MSTKLCDYGCGQNAFFKKIGRGRIEKWSCNKNIQHCPKMRQNHSKKTTDIIALKKKSGEYEVIKKKIITAMVKTGADGLTPREKAAINMRKTRRSDGSFLSGAAKAALTKRTMICSDGLTVEQKAVIRGKKTRQMVIDDIGTTRAQATGRKSMDSRIKNIDEKTGLTMFEIGQINSKKLKPYPNLTTLYYGSSYEFKWLKSIEQLAGIDYIKENVKRGPNFRYLDIISKCMRNYPSDFIVDRTVYEIKSCYIFSIDRDRNVIKFDSVIKQGFSLKIVLDFVEYDWESQKKEILQVVDAKFP
jgi:hypothetical protein